jgi:hypothetical protein
MTGHPIPSPTVATWVHDIVVVAGGPKRMKYRSVRGPLIPANFRPIDVPFSRLFESEPDYTHSARRLHSTWLSFVRLQRLFVRLFALNEPTDPAYFSFS